MRNSDTLVKFECVHRSLATCTLSVDSLLEGLHQSNMSCAVAAGSCRDRPRLTESSDRIVLTALEKYFHYSSLRPGQLEAVQPVLNGEDVFIRMATGSGKSLCMFLPPLSSSDTSAAAVVISPLNGLMEQQVSSGGC